MVILFGAKAVTKSRGPTQAAKVHARGYRTTRNFINMAYLVAGRLTQLPASLYDTTSRVVTT
jgi:hypothetical protein